MLNKEREARQQAELRAAAERQRADEERERADAERRWADEQRQRAEQQIAEERKRFDEQRRRAEQQLAEERQRSDAILLAMLKTLLQLMQRRNNTPQSQSPPTDGSI